MYTRFFGLAQAPFSIAPDPRYLFMSERHREALAHLLYGLDGGGGFVLLTGEIGAGKTTVCRLFLEQIPADCNVAYIFNPKQTVLELLQSICVEFGVDLTSRTERATVKEYIDPLNVFLLAAHAAHRNNVLIIDEAQNLSADVLEQLRLLTNLETNERKLLQIILIGQPELRGMLARPELEQLAQRIIARFHLAALSADETAHYVAHRLTVAGLTQASPFGARVMRRIHRLARGVPRRINLLCDRALLGAYAQGRPTVDLATVAIAAREVFGGDEQPGRAFRGRRLATAAGAVLVVAAAGMAVFAARDAILPREQSSAPKVAAGAADQSGVPIKPAMTTSLASAASAMAPTGAASPRPDPDSHPAPASIAKAPATTDAVTWITVPRVAGAAPELDATVRDWPVAIRRLGALWQIDMTGTDPCRSAAGQSIYCFASHNGLTEIRQLGRPGVLTLWDDANGKYYALLLGLDRDAALLQIGGRRETVTLAALARRWRGAYTTLWRGPAGVSRPIMLGDVGDAVDWLTSRLAIALGTPAPAPGLRFDSAWSARVKEFQLKQGMPPDGRPGPQTMIRLASLTGEGEPRLLAAAEFTSAMSASAGSRVPTAASGK